MVVYRTNDLRSAIFAQTGPQLPAWSAAAVQSNRLAALRTQAAGDASSLALSAVTASGCEAFFLQVELPCPAAEAAAAASAAPTLVEPTVAAGSTVATHAHEVQSVAACAGADCVFAASVDASGRANVARVAPGCDAAAAAAAQQPHKRARTDSSGMDSAAATATAAAAASWWLNPTVDPLGRGGLSWAGVAIAPGASTAQDLSVATAHFGSRRLSFYRGAEASVAERTVYTYQQPTDLTFLSVPPAAAAAADGSGTAVGDAAASGYSPCELLAVTEGHQLSIWDMRASSPCIARLSPDSGVLDSVCPLGSSAVACAGHDRIVHVRSFSAATTSDCCFMLRATRLVRTCRPPPRSVADTCWRGGVSP